MAATDPLVGRLVDLTARRPVGDRHLAILGRPPGSDAPELLATAISADDGTCIQCDDDECERCLRLGAPRVPRALVGLASLSRMPGTRQRCSRFRKVTDSGYLTDGGSKRATEIWCVHRSSLAECQGIP